MLPFLKWWDSSGGRQEEQVCRLHVSFLEALKFGQDVFSVRVLPQGGDVWTNLLHQNFPLVQFGHVYHFLHHVIGILVLHHRVKGTVRAANRKNLGVETSLTIQSGNLILQISLLCRNVAIGFLSIYDETCKGKTKGLE